MRAAASDRVRILATFHWEQRAVRGIERAHVRDSAFAATYDRLAAELVAAGYPSAFTHRQVVRNWAALHDARPEVRDAQAITESANQIVAELTAAGWPARSNLGNAGAFGLAALLGHADDDPDLRRACLPVFRESVIGGQADVRHYMHVFDRQSAIERGVQRFGSLMIPGSDHQPVLLVPLDADEKSVNEERAAIGATSLGEAKRLYRNRVTPGPFLIPFRRRDWIELSARLAIPIARGRWSTRRGHGQGQAARQTME